MDLPLIAAKYNKALLSLIDAEKQLQVNKEVMNLDERGGEINVLNSVL